MMPSHEKTSFGRELCAGLIGDEEADVQRCSRGEGAGMPCHFIHQVMIAVNQFIHFVNQFIHFVNTLYMSQ